MEIETALHILVAKRMAEGEVIKDTLECKAILSNFSARRCCNEELCVGGDVKKCANTSGVMQRDTARLSRCLRCQLHGYTIEFHVNPTAFTYKNWPEEYSIVNFINHRT